MKKIMQILLIVNTFFFIISLAISIVVLFRPFYYFQINSLNIPKTTNLEYHEIKESYDGIIDYTTLYKDFSIGNLTCSDDCIDHFKDCRILFTICFSILLISSVIKFIERKKYRDLRIKKYRVSFWSSCFILSLFMIITLITVIVGFNQIFELFHNIFFLGKSNWILDPNIDTIINIFPKEFFFNAAITVLLIINLISSTIIIKELIKQRK